MIVGPVERAYFALDPATTRIEPFGCLNPLDSIIAADETNHRYLFIVADAEGKKRPLVVNCDNRCDAAEAVAKFADIHAEVSEGFLCELLGRDAEGRTVYRSFRYIENHKPCEAA